MHVPMADHGSEVLEFGKKATKYRRYFKISPIRLVILEVWECLTNRYRKNLSRTMSDVDIIVLLVLEKLIV